MNYKNSLKIYRYLKGVIDHAFEEAKLVIVKSAKIMVLKVEDMMKLTGLSKKEIKKL